MLEVDLEYPKHLHKSHSDYPLAPEKTCCERRMALRVSNRTDGKQKYDKHNKNFPSLMDKNKYVVHYKNLMLYLSLGMKLKRIYRVLEFDEKPWMEPYIRLNTELRKEAKSAFEKEFYKLINNSIFRKTMENLRKKSRNKISQNIRQLK